MSWTRTSWAALAPARSSAPAASGTPDRPRARPGASTTAGEHGRSRRGVPAAACSREAERVDAGAACRRAGAGAGAGCAVRRPAWGVGRPAGAARGGLASGLRPRRLAWARRPASAVSGSTRCRRLPVGRRHAVGRSSAGRRRGPRPAARAAGRAVGLLDVAQPPGVPADRGLEDVAGEPAVAERRSRAAWPPGSRGTASSASGVSVVVGAVGEPRRRSRRARRRCSRRTSIVVRNRLASPGFGAMNVGHRRRGSRRRSRPGRRGGPPSP